MKLVLLLFLCLSFSFSSNAQKPTPTPATQPFLMAVEDVFYITGRGVVATGKVERGLVKVGDTIEIVGIKATKTATVSGIEMFRKMLDEAKTGENVGIMLRGVEKADVERGQVLAKPGSAKAYIRVKAMIDLLSTEEKGRSTPISDKYRGLFYVRTGGFSGVISFPAGTSSIVPGTKGTLVDIAFEKPVVIEKGQIFGIREAGRTVGSGKVTAVIP